MQHGGAQKDDNIDLEDIIMLEKVGSKFDKLLQQPRLHEPSRSSSDRSSTKHAKGGRVKKLMSYLEGDSLMKEIEKSLEKNQKLVDILDDEDIEKLMQKQETERV